MFQIFSISIFLTIKIQNVFMNLKIKLIKLCEHFKII